MKYITLDDIPAHLRGMVTGDWLPYQVRLAIFNEKYPGCTFIISNPVVTPIGKKLHIAVACSAVNNEGVIIASGVGSEYATADDSDLIHYYAAESADTRSRVRCMKNAGIVLLRELEREPELIEYSDFPQSNEYSDTSSRVKEEEDDIIKEQEKPKRKKPLPANLQKEIADAYHALTDYGVFEDTLDNILDKISGVNDIRSMISELINDILLEVFDSDYENVLGQMLDYLNVDELYAAPSDYLAYILKSLYDNEAHYEAQGLFSIFEFNIETLFFVKSGNKGIVEAKSNSMWRDLVFDEHTKYPDIVMEQIELVKPTLKAMKNGKDIALTIPSVKLVAECKYQEGNYVVSIVKEG